MFPTKPWAVISYYNGDPPTGVYCKSFERLRPNDFYFACQPNKEKTNSLAFITPIEYFINYREMFGFSMPIIHMLPDSFVEKTRCVYETGIKDDVAAYKLMRCGLSYSKAFQEYIDRLYSTWNK